MQQQGNLGEDSPPTVQVEFANDQRVPGRVDKARERSHANEGKRRAIPSGRSRQQQRARRFPAENEAVEAWQFAAR